MKTAMKHGGERFQNVGMFPTDEKKTQKKHFKKDKVIRQSTREIITLLEKFIFSRIHVPQCYFYAMLLQDCIFTLIDINIYT